MIPPALASICRRHGIELEALSPVELRERLPEIIAAVEHDVEAMARSNRRELVKSASLVHAALKYAPNPGIDRDECLTARSANAPQPGNAIFDDFGFFSAMSEGDR